MNKVKTVYFCQNCGAQSAKWVGKCSSCGEWNTYVEEVLHKASTHATHKPFGNDKKSATKPVALINIEATEFPRLITPDQELNRVLGGGIVPGSIILMAGEPGIGKSTLLLQLALKLKSKKVLYVSGEESPQQVKMRADRIGISNEACYVLAETNTSSIFQ